jgi:steroid Delta-isomerase
MPPATDDARMQSASAALVDFFEHLAPAHLDRLAEFYRADARFKDPFNDVCGIPAIRAIFAHMFDTLEAPRFVVTERLCQGRQCFLTWDFVFRFRRWRPRQIQTIHGATHLLLDDNGRITLHRDYWDAAEELYEKLPAISTLMKWLKKQAATPPPLPSEEHHA